MWGLSFYPLSIPFMTVWKLSWQWFWMSEAMLDLEATYMKNCLVIIQREMEAWAVPIHTLIFKMLVLGFIYVGELTSNTPEVWSLPHSETWVPVPFPCGVCSQNPDAGSLCPSTWEAKREEHEPKASLCYIAINTLSQKPKSSILPPKKKKQRKQDYCMDQRFDLTNCLLGKPHPHISQVHFLQMASSSCLNSAS